MLCAIAITRIENGSNFEFAKSAKWLVLTEELWCLCCDNLRVGRRLYFYLFGLYVKMSAKNGWIVSLVFKNSGNDTTTTENTFWCHSRSPSGYRMFFSIFYWRIRCGDPCLLATFRKNGWTDVMYLLRSRVMMKKQNEWEDFGMLRITSCVKE